MPLRVESPPLLGAPRACPESAAARVFRDSRTGSRAERAAAPLVPSGSVLPAGVLVRVSGLFRSPAKCGTRYVPDASGAGGLLARAAAFLKRCCLAGEVFAPFLTLHRMEQDYPLNLSISLSGGEETNQDAPSNGE